ncbi:MAG: PAS domain S-box protein [Kofleriaceae bacterium]
MPHRAAGAGSSPDGAIRWSGMTTVGLWIHVIAHALIAIAYASILISLLYFLARRRDVRTHWLFLCAGGFMLALGTARALEVWRVWSPGSGPVEIVEAFAGVVAIPTAVMLARLIPRALAIPSLEALRTSNEAVVALAAQFRELLESAPDAMVIADQAGRIFLVNAEAERMFGYGRAEMIGQPVELLLPEQMRAGHPERRAAFFAAPRAPGKRAGIELQGRRKDGVEFPIEVSLSPLETPTGALVSTAIRDLTERKQTETTVRALMVAAQVVEAAPTAMVMVNQHRAVALVNRRTCDLFGYTREQLIGLPFDDLVIGGIAPLGRRQDGSEVPIEISVSLLETPSGTCTLAAIVDTTERRRQEDELRRSNADLEQFAYIASHDLQEPLRMVASYTELLGERYRGKLDAKADKYIHYAVDGAKRMQCLVADLLAYSRVGSQGKALVPVVLDEVVQHVRDGLARAIAESGGVVHVPEALPVVLADEGQLGQLLQNLIGNALKFRGEAAPRVTISARLTERRWQITVRDNGIGIDMQYSQRIFDMFQRIHERGKFDGSGIGLAIAKRIVERHGGRIWIESAPGAGAAFHFTLHPSRKVEA